MPDSIYNRLKIRIVNLCRINIFTKILCGNLPAFQDRRLRSRNESVDDIIGNLGSCMRFLN